MSRFADFFKDNWQRMKRYYTLKHSQPYRGKGTLEKGQAVEKSAKHSIWILIIGIFVLAFLVLVVASFAHGITVSAEFHNWVTSFMGMKVPATDPRKP